MGELATLGSAFLWTFTSIYMRFGSTRLDLLWLNALRTVFGCCVLVVVVALLPGGLAVVQGLPPLPLLLLLSSTLIGFAVGDTCYFRSAQLIGVSRAMPLSAWYPLLTVIIAVTLLGEALTWRLAGGTLLILAGVYLIAVPRGEARPALAGPALTAGRQGILLACLAAICWGVSTNVVKVALDDPAVDLMGANLVRLALAALILTSFARLRGGVLYPRKLLRLGWGFLLLLAVVGAVGSTISPLLWLYGVQQAGAAKAALLGSTSPLFGLPLAVLLLGEKLTGRTVSGTVLTTLGVWLIL